MPALAAQDLELHGRKGSHCGIGVIFGSTVGIFRPNHGIHWVVAERCRLPMVRTMFFFFLASPCMEQNGGFRCCGEDVNFKWTVAFRLVFPVRFGCRTINTTVLPCAFVQNVYRIYYA